jgi:uncharacterized protein (DUF58 family)
VADTDQTWNFLDSEVLGRLSRLSLGVRLPMLGSVTGLHKSATRGSSVEFAEYRKYTPGDDLKHLDWRVLARTDRYYIKEFEADTNLRCYLVVDTSASMGFVGASGNPRLDVARKIAGTLSHLLSHQGDSVGLFTFNDDTGLKEIPARHTPAHLRNLYQTLSNTTTSGETTLAKALHDIAEKVRQRSLVIVISDFFVEVPELLNCFKHLRFKKHDVAAFHLIDKQEIDFDFNRPIRFVDMESGFDMVTDPAVVRDGYRAALMEWMEGLKHGCREFNVDYHLCSTDSYEPVLAEFMLQRIRRKKSAGR